MNKKLLILTEAKRLFGHYGYLGFTLKQLAQACEMTSPALYYFYSSKADLFRDCLLSELTLRREVTERCIERSTTLAEFGHAMAYEAIEVCDAASFRTGQAMSEIVHLSEPLQAELRAAWESMLINPLESFLQRVLPDPPAGVSYHLLATFMINIATFSASHTADYSRDELAALFTKVANGLEPTHSTVA